MKTIDFWENINKIENTIVLGLLIESLLYDHEAEILNIFCENINKNENWCDKIKRYNPMHFRPVIEGVSRFRNDIREFRITEPQFWL